MTTTSDEMVNKLDDNMSLGVEEVLKEENIDNENEEVIDNTAVQIVNSELDSKTTNLRDVQCLFCDERCEDEHKLFNHLLYMHVIELVEFLSKKPIPRKVIEDKLMVTVNRSDISEDAKYVTLGVLDSILGNEESKTD